jgi:[ribosomal protein S5]-alanine N-acetyltransferase
MLLETKRLFIRPFAQADAEAMLLVFSDPEVMQFSDFGMQDLEWTKRWLEQMQSEYETVGYAKYAVLEKSSGEVIGYCGFGSLENTPALGYRLRRSAWGFGYATEAAQGVLEWGFGQLRFCKVVAQVDPNNLASVRVAKRLGMVFEREVMLEGYTHPDHVYVLDDRKCLPELFLEWVNDNLVKWQSFGMRDIDIRQSPDWDNPKILHSAWFSFFYGKGGGEIIVWRFGHCDFKLLALKVNIPSVIRFFSSWLKLKTIMISMGEKNIHSLKQTSIRYLKIT